MIHHYDRRTINFCILLLFFYTAPAYVKELRESAEKTHALACLHLESSQRRQKNDYDFKLKERLYQLGDAVYQLDTATKKGQSSKLKPIWKGPYLVIEIVTKHVYRLTTKKNEFVIHHDRLKLCEDRELPLWLSRRGHLLLGTQEMNTILETSLRDDHYIGIPELFKVPETPKTHVHRAPPTNIIQTQIKPNKCNVKCKLLHL